MLARRPVAAAVVTIGGTFAASHRRGARSIGALLVIRLLVGNGTALLAVGGLYPAYGAPGGLVVGGVLATAALGLCACLLLANPYRRSRRR